MQNVGMFGVTLNLAALAAGREPLFVIPGYRSVACGRRPIAPVCSSSARSDPAARTAPTRRLVVRAGHQILQQPTQQAPPVRMCRPERIIDSRARPFIRLRSLPRVRLLRRSDNCLLDFMATSSFLPYERSVLPDTSRPFPYRVPADGRNVFSPRRYQLIVYPRL